MPVVGHVPGGDGGAQQVHPAQVFLQGDLGLPLEGALGLGDEAGGGDGDLHAPVLVFGVHPPAVEDLVGHLGDAQDVLVRLGGQAQHVIELHRVPAAGKGDGAGVQHVLVGDVFVHRVPQALAAALHGKGQAALAHLLQPLHDLHGEVVRPEGGQGQADAAGFAVFQQPVAEGGKLPVVAGGEGEQGHVLVAGVLQGFDALADQGLRLLGPEGAVHMPRLAEAAAPGAAPEELQAHPVVDHLGAGHDGLCGEGHLVQIRDDALRDPGGSTVLRRHGSHGAVGVVAHLVERGHVHALDLRCLHQKIVLGPARELGLPQQGQQLVVHLFPLAHHEEVQEGGHGLGVHRGGAAGPDEGQQVRPVRRAQGDPRHVQHVQHGGIGHLIADGEGQGVKVPHRIAAFQGVERDLGLLHLLIHVPPGGKDPLAPHKGQAVHGVVEDAHAQVRHADLIGIGKAEGQTQVHLALVLDDLIVFAAGIPGGLLHPGKDAFQRFIHGTLHVIKYLV